MKFFMLNGWAYKAKAVIDHILIDPHLPDNFWTTPIRDCTTEELEKWEGLPFIITFGDHFSGYCLNREARDRPTLLHASNDLAEVIKCQVSLGCCDQSMNRLELIGGDFK